MEVPNLLGKTPKDLQKMYFQFPIEAAGHGEVIIKQLPEPGEKVPEGSVIRLLLGERGKQEEGRDDKKRAED